MKIKLAPAYTRILNEFIDRINSENKIMTDKESKYEIADKLNLSIHTIDKSVKVFSKKGIFIRLQRAIYVLNEKELPNLPSSY